MKFQLARSISWQEYREIVYVFQESLKKVYIFPDTARDFWMTFLECDSVEDMIDQLCDEYGEDFREDIENDLKTFLDNLLQYEIIQEVQ